MVNWVSSKRVIARITRNINGVDPDIIFNLPEWIAEAVLKLKTTYSLVLKDKLVNIHYYKFELPCHSDAIAAITYNGQRLLLGNEISNVRSGGVSQGKGFVSVIRYPGVTNLDTLDETDINNFPYYLNTVEALGLMPICFDHWYRPNYNKIDTSIEEGKVRVYYWSIPTDEEDFPLIVDNEYYETAIYWYCRMMMIGAGYQDPVFRYQDCERDFEKYLRIAINDISYGSPEDKLKTVLNTTGLFPLGYDWSSAATIDPFNC